MIPELKEDCMQYKDNVYPEFGEYCGQGDLRREISCVLGKMSSENLPSNWSSRAKRCPENCDSYKPQSKKRD